MKRIAAILISAGLLATSLQADSNNTYTTNITATTVVAFATNLTYAYVSITVSNANYYYEADSDSTNALASGAAVFPAGSAWNYGAYASPKIPSYIKICPVSGSTAIVSVVRTPR